MLKGMVGLALLALAIYCLTSANSPIWGWLLLILATLWLLLAIPMRTIIECYGTIIESNSEHNSDNVD